MKLEQGKFCPLIKKDCIELKCAWFTQVRGFDHNKGIDIDEYACAIAWMPVLIIDNSQKQRETGAAVESFRNEVARASGTLTLPKQAPIAQIK
jgi:hypothetical protein